LDQLNIDKDEVESWVRKIARQVVMAIVPPKFNQLRESMKQRYQVLEGAVNVSIEQIDEEIEQVTNNVDDLNVRMIA
jgi:hypothetical protein